MIRVIVADDHTLVREGICALLESAGDITVVATVANGQQALDEVEQHKPDVLVLDLAMERLDGIQTIQQLRQRGEPTRVVILSMYSDQHYVQQALRAGAKGYLLKNAVKEELLLAVRSAYRGYSYLSPEVSLKVVSIFTADEPQIYSSPLEELTPRETEILKLVAEGHTSSEISDMLQVSVKTVQKHRANLMSKLNAHNTASLTQAAIKYRLVRVD